MRIPELIQRIGRENFPEDLDSYLETFLPDTLLKSETLQQAFAVTDKEMEALYREGYQHYLKNQIDDASIFFRFLVILDPFKKRAWMGLGACQQLQEEHSKALHCYAVASILDRHDPQPHELAQQCYEAMGETEEAEKARQMAARRLLKIQRAPKMLS